MHMTINEKKKKKGGWPYVEKMSPIHLGQFADLTDLGKCFPLFSNGHPTSLFLQIYAKHPCKLIICSYEYLTFITGVIIVLNIIKLDIIR